MSYLDSERQNMIKLAKDGLTVKEIAELLYCSESKVRLGLKDSGFIKSRKKFTIVTEDEEVEIKYLYLEKELDFSEIATEMKRDYNTVRRVIVNSGIKIRERKSSNPRTINKDKEILNHYNENRTISQISHWAKVSQDEARNALKRANLVPSKIKDNTYLSKYVVKNLLEEGLTEEEISLKLDYPIESIQSKVKDLNL